MVHYPLPFKPPTSSVSKASSPSSPAVAPAWDGEMSKALAANGPEKIYIVGRREKVLEEEAAAQYPCIIIPLPSDVTSRSSLASAAATVRREIGYINLLICNAGGSGPKLDGLKPHYTLCPARAEIPMWDSTALERGQQTQELSQESQVIATPSTASFLRHPRAEYAYLSSKAGVVSMVKCLSTFCIPWVIRFNAIAAGLFSSEMSEPLLQPYVIDSSKKVTEEGVFSRSYQPAERAGSEEDMGGDDAVHAEPKSTRDAYFQDTI
ncbi:MAG: hypothetical protein Q9184_004090 [Pyrenodesmia sp. 2 TL-2023]